MQQGALITSQGDRLFLETYLIDTSVTKKNKKVNDKTIDDNVLNSRGHPLTLYQRPIDNGDKWIWDHPVIETNSLDQNIALQEQYAIGREIKSKKVKDGHWNAIYEITNEGAKKLFAQYEGKTIPFYTSTGIIHNSKENPLDITDWRIIHNAIVSEPANGFEKAGMVDMCKGTEQSCSAILTASIKQIPFCVTSALQNYISSLSSSLTNFPHYTMSSENTAQTSVGTGTDTKSAINYNPGFTPVNAQTGIGSIPNSLTPNNPPEQFKAKEESKTKTDETDYKALADQLKSELKQVKNDNESKTNENKTINERLASLERENSRNSRKSQVLTLLQQYPSAFVNPEDGQVNQQEYSKIVLEWIDKGYDDKTIQELLEAKVIKVNNALASRQKPEGIKQVYSSLTSEDKTVGYQTTQMTTASDSNRDSSLPIWERVFDLTNAKTKNAAEKYQRIRGDM